jgi:hypothetical protein
MNCIAGVWDTIMYWERAKKKIVLNLSKFTLKCFSIVKYVLLDADLNMLLY